MTFEGGIKKLYNWDGQNRSYDITLHSDKKVINAKVDPDFKVMLDKNFINNSLSREKQSNGIKSLLKKVMTSLQHIMESVTLLI